MAPRRRSLRAASVAALLVLSSFSSVRAQDDAAAGRALAWLASHLVDGDGRGAARSANALSKRAIATSLAALLAEALPDSKLDPATRERLDRAALRVAAARGIEGIAFANWMAGLGGLDLFERALRHGAKPAELAAVAALAAGWSERQNGEGGFGHGGGAPLVDFYPSTLVATSNLALLSLGLAQRLGVAVDPDCRDRCLALLRDVQAESGALPYGGREYRKGFEAGRTGGTVAAWCALGLGGDPSFRRAARYLLANLDHVPDGHASPALHVWMAALACRALGATAWRRYDEAVLTRVRRAQRDDGSFDDIVPGSPDSMKLMGDEESDAAYVASLYGLALATPRLRIAEVIAVAKSDSVPAPAPEVAIDAPLRELWSAPVDGARALAWVDGRLLALDARGRVASFDRAAGPARPIETLDLGVAAGAEIGEAHWLAHDGGAVAWVGPRADAQLPQSIGAALTREGSQIVAVGAAPLALKWRRTLDGPLARARVADGACHVYADDGALESFDLADGRSLRRLACRAPLVNAPFAPSLRRGSVVGSEAVLRAWSPDGTLAWTQRMRAPEGLTPPACSALATRGALLVVGRTDGRVQGRSLATGALEWECELGGSVDALVLLDEPPLVVAGCGDGRLHALAGGRVVWSCDVARGDEMPHGAPLVQIGGRLFVRGPDAAVRVDAASGAFTRLVVLGRDDVVAFAADAIAVAGAATVRCFAPESGAPK